MSKVAKIVTGIVLVAVSIFIPGPWSPYLASLGLSLLTQGIAEYLIKKPSQGTPAEAGKIVVRIAEPLRWLTCGRMRQGGGALFGEFDALGNFWYIVVHSDSIMTGSPLQYYADDEAITLDGSGYVTNDDFCLTTKKEIYTGSGTRVPYFQIFTTTYAEDDPTPAAITALSSAFPGKWTSDHKLVGTTFSVVKCLALGIEDRYKIYKWRGPFGLGEPAISVVANWSNVYDPRDEDQINGDPTTYAPSRNPVLVWAWFRTHRFGRNKARSSINWDMIGEQATICDQTVTGIDGTTARYSCDVAVSDDKERAVSEREILASMDAQLVFDDDGKCWPRVGYYVAADLALSRNRDIVAMESLELQNSDTETQGVIVRYTDPNAKYTMQPSAAWRNPNWYVDGQSNTFLVVDIPTIQNHNQAMRIAKAIGGRAQPLHRIAPTVGLRGLKARQKRIVDITYDNTFAGEYEIITPVEVDAGGMFCGFSAVPADASRWTLLTGEERAKPVVDGTDTSPIPDLPTGVDIDYNNARLEARFDTSPRGDVTYVFQYIATADLASDQWFTMTTSMVTDFAYSSSVDQSVQYQVRYRAEATSGRVSDWSTPNVVIDPIPLGAGALQAAVLSSWIVEVSSGVDVVTIASDGELIIDDHTRRYSDGFADVAVTGGVITTGLATGDVRSIGYDDDTRVGGAVTYNLYTDDNDAHASVTYPGRHYVGYFVVPSTGSSGGGGGGVPGGYCVTVDTPILMANADRNGPGLSRVAADLKVGAWVWTQHEITLAWGAYEIEALTFIEDDVYAAAGLPRATGAHLFWRSGAWVRADALGEPAGRAMVAKITVRDAHTYVSAGVLSHNVKAEP